MVYGEVDKCERIQWAYKWSKRCLIRTLILTVLISYGGIYMEKWMNARGFNGHALFLLYHSENSLTHFIPSLYIYSLNILSIFQKCLCWERYSLVEELDLALPSPYTKPGAVAICRQQALSSVLLKYRKEV